jgi:uncharacterized RDD family membrane protein YckC
VGPTVSPASDIDLLYGARMLARRLLSWFVDYLMILAWLGLLVLVVGLPSLAGWFDLDEVWSDRLSTDLAITVLTVVPLFAYLTVTESRSTHATLGKRRAGLEVATADGSVLSGGRVAMRNLTKGGSLAAGTHGLGPGEAEA